MMKLHLYAIGLFATAMIAVLAGCAGPQGGTLRPEKLAQVKRLGVLSIAGQRLFRDTVGFVPIVSKSSPAGALGIRTFNIHDEVLDIADWHLDDAWESFLIDSLAKNGHFEGLRIGCDRAKLFWLNEAEVRDEDLPILELRRQAAAELLRCAKQAGVDAILILVDSVGNVGPSMRFYGPTLNGRIVRTFLGFGAELLLIGSDDGELIGRTALKNPAPDPLSARTSPFRSFADLDRGPGEEDGQSGAQLPGQVAMGVPALGGTTIALRKFADMTPEEFATIRSSFVELPQTAWDTSVALLLMPARKAVK